MVVHHPESEEDYAWLCGTPEALTVVDYSATWCGPCKFMAPVFEELSQRYPEAVFVHVDIDALDQLADVQDVRGVPTFKFFRNGELLHKFSGASPQTLQDTVKQLLG